VIAAVELATPERAESRQRPRPHRNGEYFLTLDIRRELKLSRKYKSNLERLIPSSLVTRLCDGSLTLISGLPLYSVIVPNTQIVLPSRVSGSYGPDSVSVQAKKYPQRTAGIFSRNRNCLNSLRGYPASPGLSSYYRPRSST